MEKKSWLWDYNPENVDDFHEQEDTKLTKTERNQNKNFKGFPVLGRI